MSTSTPVAPPKPRTDFDVEVRRRLDDGEPADYSGWFCVRTDPFPCPAEGCNFVARHMTAAHLILVWPERDDPKLLKMADRAKRVGRNPRVAEWEPEMGPCVAWDQWVAIGQPVHALAHHLRPGDPDW